MRVGSVWFRLDPGAREAYVFDITIAQEHRRRGLATVALEAVAAEARAAGCGVLALNVFADNEPARALYRKLGFEEAAIHMNKRL